MAIPGHEFLTAHFTNNERTMVESYWVTPDGKETRVEHVEAKEGDVSWRKLLTYINIDALHENTYKHIKEQKEALVNAVAMYGKQNGISSGNGGSNEELISLLFTPFNEKKDKEMLFMTKLKLFEVNEIKKSNDRALKAELRKARTLAEAVKIGLQIYLKHLQIAEESVEE